MVGKEWLKVGVIGVDAGMCWVGDPCRVIHDEEGPEAALGKDWYDFCRLTTKHGIEGPTSAAQFDAKTGLGVCVRSGYGDGAYDVFVRKSRDGKVAELRVVFIEEG
ncbi:MAG TPA: hypothetical protein VK540_34485 [Polyangiaceae bacterium]|nr:hypothetical protein [Polyangiaceae bacterium]